MKSENSSKNWLEKYLGNLDPEQKKNVKDIWKEAEKTDESRHISVSEKEKKDVFSNIISETGINPDLHSLKEQEDKQDTDTVFKWKWIAAAAVILIAAGLSYLTIPVNYSAPYGEKLSVTLPDDSQVTLNSGSSISYNRLFSFADRDISLQGEAFFEVKENEIPFIVHTSNASIKVLGTSFNIRSWSNEPSSETSVVLTEGSLAFYPAGRPDNSVILKPGEKSILNPNYGTPRQPIKVDQDKALAWLDNRFAFESMPFVQIVREIERRFNLDIKVEPKEVLFDTLTVYYNKQVDAEQIIKDICQSKALNFRKINGGYVIEG